MALLLSCSFLICLGIMLVIGLTQQDLPLEYTDYDEEPTLTAEFEVKSSQEHNKLPISHINNLQLKNMKPGDIGYIVPWGMWVDNEKNCFVNEAYKYYLTPGGAANLKIEKLTEGYVVYLSGVNNYTWSLQKNHTYVSDDKDCFGKVIKIIN